MISKRLEVKILITSGTNVVFDCVDLEQRRLQEDCGDSPQQSRTGLINLPSAEIRPADRSAHGAARAKLTFLIDGPLMGAEARRRAALENMARDLYAARECSDAGDSRRLLLARGHNLIDVHVLHAEAIALASTWLAGPPSEVTATAAEQSATRER
ncbi:MULTISPECIES: hypothetical protein [unclassified Bradyrhizobium]|uniref:hypothetical protein n=1 Tax=unclassified Bradyrhizobium TaxID=2631580 RepID=UPI0028E6D295|nr:MULTISPECIES: hypothetical protein [unclassified Bradyrhizobium]